MIPSNITDKIAFKLSSGCRKGIKL